MVQLEDFWMEIALNPQYSTHTLAQALEQYGISFVCHVMEQVKTRNIPPYKTPHYSALVRRIFDYCYARGWRTDHIHRLVADTESYREQSMIFPRKEQPLAPIHALDAHRTAFSAESAPRFLIAPREPRTYDFE